MDCGAFSRHCGARSWRGPHHAGSRQTNLIDYTTVNYSVGGSATEGTDYTGTTTHSITIAAGQTSGTITVDPTADSTFENDETVVVTLTGGSTNSQTISLGTDTATGTITNDDGGDNTPPTITLIIATRITKEMAAAFISYSAKP